MFDKGKLTGAISEALTDANRHAETCNLTGEGDARAPYDELARILLEGALDAIHTRDHAHEWDAETMICTVCGADGAA